MGLPAAAGSVACQRRIRLELGGRTLADSAHALRVLETSHPPTIYIPPGDVDGELIVVSAARPTWCEFKGAARYVDAVVGERCVTAVGWTYPDPTAAMSSCATTSPSIPGGSTRRGWARSASRLRRATSTRLDHRRPDRSVQGAPGTLGW